MTFQFIALDLLVLVDLPDLVGLVDLLDFLSCLYNLNEFLDLDLYYHYSGPGRGGGPTGLVVGDLVSVDLELEIVQHLQHGHGKIFLS